MLPLFLKIFDNILGRIVRDQLITIKFESVNSRIRGKIEIIILPGQTSTRLIEKVFNFFGLIVIIRITKRNNSFSLVEFSQSNIEITIIITYNMTGPPKIISKDISFKSFW